MERDSHTQQRRLQAEGGAETEKNIWANKAIPSTQVTLEEFEVCDTLRVTIAVANPRIYPKE